MENQETQIQRRLKAKLFPTLEQSTKKVKNMEKAMINR